MRLRCLILVGDLIDEDHHVGLGRARRTHRRAAGSRAGAGPRARQRGDPRRVAASRASRASPDGILRGRPTGALCRFTLGPCGVRIARQYPKGRVQEPPMDPDLWSRVSQPARDRMASRAVEPGGTTRTGAIVAGGAMVAVGWFRLWESTRAAPAGTSATLTSSPSRTRPACLTKTLFDLLMIEPQVDLPRPLGRAASVDTGGRATADWGPP